MAYTVRRATAEDAPALVDLVNQVATSEEYLGIDAFPLNAAQESAFLAQADPQVFLTLVCNDGDQPAPVAVLTASRGTQRSFAHVARLALAVTSEHRNRGIGALLLDAFEGWARSVGVLKSTLSVMSHNSPAIRLFERTGYVEEGRFRGQYRLADGFVDEVWMAKRLGEES